MKNKHLSKSSREKQIIRAAGDLLKETGAYDFTVDKVVARLMVAKGTVYKYYKSKDDILAEVSVEALTLLLDYFKKAVHTETDLLQATGALVMAFYEYYTDHPQYFELIVYMERPEFSSSVRNYLMISRKIRDFFAEHIAACQEAGAMKKDLPPAYATYMIWASCMGLMNFIEAKQVFIEEIEKIDRKQLIETYTETLMAGLKS